MCELVRIDPARSNTSTIAQFEHHDSYSAGALQVMTSMPRSGAVQYLTCGAIVLLVIVLDWVLLRSVNLWILITAPLSETHFSNAIIGYSNLLNGSPFHIENQAPLEQSLTFNGVFAQPNSFSLRAVYPFLVSILSWSLGLRAAALAVNFLSLAVLVTSTFWLTRQLCRSFPAALCAAGFAALGIGSIVHLNDLSAHMLGFAVYAAATCLIFASRVWESRQPFSVHITIGVMLAIATLAYPSGLVLVLCYVLVAVRFSNWIHVIAAAALGTLARFAWEHFMDFAYRISFAFSPDKVTDFEAHAGWAVDFWVARLLHDPGHFLWAVVQALIDCLFVTFPIITIAGVMTLVLLNRHSGARLWFFGVFFAVPYVAAVFFSPVVTARGYVVYCSAFILFASLAALISTRFDRFRNAAFLRLAICTALLAGQLLWSLGPYFGYYFPAISYYLGFFHGSDAFTSVHVQNLAGDAPLWRYFGGQASFVDAGGLALGSIVQADGSGPRSFGFALLCNSFMVGLLMALAAGWATSPPAFAAARKRFSETRLSPLGSFKVWRWPAAWAALSLALVAAGYSFPTQQLRVFAPSRVTILPGPHTLTLGVRISPAASQKVLSALRGNARLQIYLFLRATGVTDAAFRLGDYRLAARQVATSHAETYFWRLDNEAVAQAISQGSAWLSADISIDEGYIGGWQVLASANRTVSPPVRAQDLPYWPSFELRLFDPDKNTTVFLGY